MNTQLRKIGNSKGIVIPAAILKILGIKEQDELVIALKNNQIVLSKKEAFDPKNIVELFSEYEQSMKTEIVFDDAEGRETW
ncbi:MAG: AbrB/MazE/SpoVT family DNA-binding domain-containing protein [Bacteroidia bacterium]|nr:AbrB/MazE/SpoVT family DNA-binding domain-containing protein [Bacteroidia bacterium]